MFLNLRRAAIAATCLFSLACGRENQAPEPGIKGELKSGLEKPVVYESWHYAPGVVEKSKGDDGLSARVHVDGVTLMAAGAVQPGDWHGREMETSDWHKRLDYYDLIKQFKAVPVDDKHKADRATILWLLEKLAETPKTLPGNDKDLPPAPSKVGEVLDVSNLVVDPTGRIDAANGLDSPNALFGSSNFSGSSGSGGGAAGVDPTIPKGKSRGANRGYRPQNFVLGYQFKQEVELYWDRVKPTGYDHSATLTKTWKRRVGNQDWEYLDSHMGCNHGACPGAPGMKHYETCAPEAVMSGWYAYDTECKGNWLTDHLCNDDTSIQIANARGIWTGNNCPGTIRGIKPHCGPQWKE